MCVSTVDAAARTVISGSGHTPLSSVGREAVREEDGAAGERLDIQRASAQRTIDRKSFTRLGLCSGRLFSLFSFLDSMFKY